MVAKLQGDRSAFQSSMSSMELYDPWKFWTPLRFHSRHLRSWLWQVQGTSPPIPITLACALHTCPSMGAELGYTATLEEGHSLAESGQCSGTLGHPKPLNKGRTNHDHDHFWVHLAGPHFPFLGYPRMTHQMSLLHSGTQRNHKDFSSDVPSTAVLVWHQMQNFFGKLWLWLCLGRP